MLLHDAPYLGAINGGSQLRVIATRLQNYAVLNYLNGGSYGADVLAGFWADYKLISRKEWGTPYDGLYIGGGLDPRPALYKVASAVRMSKNFYDQQALGEFISFFEMQAKSLSDKVSIVDSVRLVIEGSDAPDQKFPIGSTAVARFLLADADGHQVPAGIDKPLLGYTQMTTTEDAAWVANYDSRYSSGAARAAVVNPKPGRHTLKATYILPDSTVVGTLTYIRLNEDGSDPTEGGTDPILPKGRNGVV